MVPTAPSTNRVTVDGKFFRLGERKFCLKGVTYGPFWPDAGEGTYASREQTARDFAQIRELGANLIRVYHVPPRWLLDLATSHQLRVLIDIPWNKHLCFLDSPPLQEQTRQTIRNAVQNAASHSAIFAWSMVNELAPDIVRWSGARAI